MVYYRAIRIDASFTEEDKIIEFCNQNKNLFYIYAKEISKKTQKEHFHIVLKTERHPDTITKDIKKLFKVNNDRQFSNTQVNDITKIIAYTLKDGNYFIHWDNSEQIDEAVKSILTFKEEENLKTLKEKVIYNMNKLEDIDTLQNTDLMFAILKWFKTRELAYPTQHWLKSTMVAFYMQNPTQNINLRNIETLYNIKNSWVENK